MLTTDWLRLAVLSCFGTKIQFQLWVLVKQELCCLQNAARKWLRHFFHDAELAG